ARAEDELGHARGEDAEALLVLAQTLLGGALLAAVEGYLDEALAGFQRQQQARGPETRPILPLMPTLIERAAARRRLFALLCRNALSVILGGEDDIRARSQNFGLGKPEQPFRAHVPARGAPTQICREDCEVFRALDDEL